MNVIEVSQLRVEYDEVTAVHDLSITLEQGKIYGFVGPNGAGKTSTIKALAGVIEPTQGTILLNGFDLDLHREKALRHVGYMPDFSPVYENLKVWEYLDVFAAAYDIKASERPHHVEKWLNKSDLVSKRDALIKGLSRGMRQRLVLAKTLESDPNILFLDEPASGLDPIARKHMRDLIKGASQNGATVLISSHILSELSEFIDCAIILEKGKLVVCGTIDEIRQKIGGEQKLIVKFADVTAGKEIIEKLLLSQNIAPNQVTCDKTNYVINFGNDKNSAAQFLNKILSIGITIVECSIKNDTIEDIFHKIGAKEVA